MNHPVPPTGPATLVGADARLGRRHLLERLVVAGPALPLVGLTPPLAGLPLPLEWLAGRRAVAASLLRRIDVTDSAQLAAALEDALPGDDIVLAAGSYPGAFVLDASGTPAHPIVVRAAAPQAAELRGKLTLNGAFAVVYQFAGIGRDTQIEVYGPDNRVLRCAFTHSAQPRGAVCMFNGAHRTEVGYCSVVDFEHRGFLVRGGRDIAQDCHIHHNLVKGSRSRGAAATAAILIGEGQSDTLRRAGARVDFNLVENHDTGVGGIEFKCSGNIGRFNTLRDSNSRIEVRNGADNDWVGCAVINAQGPVVWGRNCRVIGCYNDGGRHGNWSDIGPGRGAGTFDEYVGGAVAEGSYPRAEGCSFIGNRGILRLGIGTGDAMPVDTHIEAHDGLLERPADAVVTGGATVPASLDVPAAVVLQAADVGPRAGL